MQVTFLNFSEELVLQNFIVGLDIYTIHYLTLYLQKSIFIMLYLPPAR